MSRPPSTAGSPPAQSISGETVRFNRQEQTSHASSLPSDDDHFEETTGRGPMELNVLSDHGVAPQRQDLSTGQNKQVDPVWPQRSPIDPGGKHTNPTPVTFRRSGSGCVLYQQDAGSRRCGFDRVMGSRPVQSLWTGTVLQPAMGMSSGSASCAPSRPRSQGSWTSPVLAFSWNGEESSDGSDSMPGSRFLRLLNRSEVRLRDPLA